jgi:hypothetical protein
MASSNRRVSNRSVATTLTAFSAGRAYRFLAKLLFEAICVEAAYSSIDVANHRRRLLAKLQPMQKYRNEKQPPSAPHVSPQLLKRLAGDFANGHVTAKGATH